MTKLDDIDKQAEAEGNAIKKSFQTDRPLGKRLAKIRKGHATGERIIQTKVERRHV